MTDPITPTLFPLGEEIKAKHQIPRCPKMFGVVGYYPRDHRWKIFENFYDSLDEEKARRAAENLAQKKAKAGWLKCRIITLDGLQDPD